MQQAHALIAEAFSTRVINVGTTTTADVQCKAANMARSSPQFAFALGRGRGTHLATGVTGQPPAPRAAALNYRKPLFFTESAMRLLGAVR